MPGDLYPVDRQAVYDRIDKSGWGPGPWQDEPDAELWTDPDTGYTCAVRRAGQEVGSLAGYVAIPHGHPWYRRDRDDIDADVHGSITFSKMDVEDPLHRWWIGFDCGHAFDYCPGIEAVLREAGFQHTRIPDDLDLHSALRTTYKTIEYVRAECKSLARQAREAAGSG